MTEVRLETFDAIDGYARIPTAFLVTSLLLPLPHDGAPSGFVLEERSAPSPFVKNYDAIPDNHPTDWPKHFDTAQWQLFSAFQGITRVGGAVAFVTPGTNASDAPFAELWDLRVSPTSRRTGVGTAVFRAVQRWAADSGCGVVRIETQHINVAACRFYERQGCTLHSVRAGAYPDFPGEVRLIWYKTFS